MSEPSQPISFTFEVPSHPEAYFVTRRQTRPYWLHLLLLLLTMLTTLIVGAHKRIFHRVTMREIA